MGPSKNLGVDLGTTGGDWLFRQGELVLGPVPASQLVEKLYQGDLDGATEVAPLGANQFRPLSEVEFFRVHLAKAEAKWRVDAAARASQARDRKRRNVKIGAVAAVALVAATGAALGARYLAVYMPWKKAGPIEISTNAPVIRMGARVDEELVDYPGAVPTARPAERPGGRPAAKPLALAATKRGPKLSDPSADPDGLQTGTFDLAAINSVVQAKKASLNGCLRAEVQNRPDLSGEIPIEFVIGNGGRVTKVWVDHPALKNGPFKDCLLKELQKWPFAAFEGEQPTVSLSFHLKKRS